ncbi:GNAT family N-acetyltransferase [Streptomyces sp. WAC 05379]|uniref:GNAT family N-acetyltransferase n=1 Tax=Streptomyces sp. WAC 05379 TaxID=2203207 RepID=UPI000F7372D5|nr:GNAT family N-acetyltransferase [Streptomyces sp. WAC 05379]RSN91151.1 GNAT family N-acetyltransferase [Streptomyces sp. WAC 05379]
MGRDTPTTEAIIRPRTDEDVPSAAAALVKVHDTDGYPVEGVNDPETWLTPPDLLAAWVAVLDQRVVGHVALSHPHGEDAVSLWLEQSQDTEGQVAVLARLFVTPEARHGAIGKQLMQAATNHAGEHGRRLVLDVMAKDTAAMRLYERLGWRRIGTAKHTYGAAQQIEAICYVSPAP